jgi:hypothetical protein
MAPTLRRATTPTDPIATLFEAVDARYENRDGALVIAAQRCSRDDPGEWGRAGVVSHRSGPAEVREGSHIPGVDQANVIGLVFAGAPSPAPFLSLWSQRRVCARTPVHR